VCIRAKVGQAPWREFHISQMGLALKRKAEQPAAPWTTLTVLATTEGQIAWHDRKVDPDTRSTVKKQVSRLRGVLRRLFGIEDDPFVPYTKDEGYKTRFRISDARDR
jgi:hypothetical protein